MAVVGVNDTRTLTESEIHDVLRNERRARTLKYLKSTSGTVTLRELAEQLATLETGESPPPRNIRESVYNSLHQTHLPKLHDLGIVTYEHNRKTITLCEEVQQVDLYMEVVPDHGVTWATYYRTLGVIALVVVVLAGIGVPVFTSLPTATWASVFLVLFAVSTLYQLWQHRWLFLGQLR